MRLTIEVNDDIDYVLTKLARKRKTTIGKIINKILQEWLDKYDEELYRKSEPKNG